MRTPFAEEIFRTKYSHRGKYTWPELVEVMVSDVTKELISKSEKEAMVEMITGMYSIPAGRYLYYAGRPTRFYNNCFCFEAQDSREGWADLLHRTASALMCGGGVGIEYSKIRPRGELLKRTGGEASGPVALMQIINEVGRFVRQGGSRRSALWAGLHCTHRDIPEFIRIKDWSDEVMELKARDFDFPAPLDCTNLSIGYDQGDQVDPKDSRFLEAVGMSMRVGCPGFSFNFDNPEENKRNACCEITTRNDNDVCNMGSVNLSVIETIDDFAQHIELLTMFLMCGGLTGEVPTREIAETRAKNGRIGVGLMGIHEWLLKRGYRYEMNRELLRWLEVYRGVTDRTAVKFAARLGIKPPIKRRAIAPNGTIGILASTSTGIEPIFAVAYKRRYLEGDNWMYQYVVDGTAKYLIDQGIHPDAIETSLDLSYDPERRIEFQAQVQEYVDHGISSTINLPRFKNANVERFAELISKYAPRLRGLTFYPDGARKGQPLTKVDYEEAVGKEGRVFEEKYHDVCELTGKSTCG